LKVIGTLTIHAVDVRSGGVVWTFSKRNTITYDAGDIVRSLLAQRTPPADPAPADYMWGSMRFGTSGTAPTRYDTDLLAEIPAARKQLGDSQKINGVTGEITLQATLDTGDANGYTLREAGIFTAGTGWNGPVGGWLRMFSRQVHPAYEKTSALRLEYAWIMQFTA
jgi:hypothetical protein